MKTSKDEQLCGVLDPSLPYRIVRFDTLPSTNAYLLRLAREGEKEGLVVVAGAQSEGRGRFSRVFYSPDGTGVYMSLLLRPAFAPEHFPLLTALAGTAAAEAAELNTPPTISTRPITEEIHGAEELVILPSKMRKSELEEKSSTIGVPAGELIAVPLLQVSEPPFILK